MTDDPMVGETLLQYRIERMLGKGSMGKVYYGVDTRDNTPVAIKTMSEDSAEDDEMLQRFQREARVAHEIKHENVAHVFASGSFKSAPYLIMEYIDGSTLAEMVKAGGPMDVAAAIQYMRQTAEGLKAATEHGSLHRDIKPANLMVTKSHKVKIVDFGIARNHGGDSLRTAVGVVLGSPYYMSPEQSAAKPLDHRSDIYSLGATFYYLLTARPPFEGKNLVEVIQKRAKNELRPIGALNPNVSKRVSDVVYKMMSTKPEERYQSYDDLIRALDDAAKAPKAPPEVVRPSPVAAPAPIKKAPKPSLRDRLDEDAMRWILIGAGVAILVAAGLILYFI